MVVSELEKELKMKIVNRELLESYFLTILNSSQNSSFISSMTEEIGRSFLGMTLLHLTESIIEFNYFDILDVRDKELEDIIDEKDSQSDLSAQAGNDEESETLIGKRIPIPTETFLEELSIKMEIHPISIYWLIKEMREDEGVVCWPECKRYVEDYFTVMILRMLGFRWPKQVEAGEPVPEWADKDGIIPITDHTGEKTLPEHIRDRIGVEFGEYRI